MGADRVREEAATLQPTTVHATDLGMRQSVFLTSQSHTWTLLRLDREALQAVVRCAVYVGQTTLETDLCMSIRANP